MIPPRDPSPRDPTGDRFRDLGETERDRVAAKLSSIGASESLIRLVESGGKLPSEEEAAVFGDTLPLGIRLQR